MPDRIEWALLAYRLPRVPSTPRIRLWRTCRRLGVVQVLDGLVALPADARTHEQLEWLADAVLEAGGEATVWLARLSSAAQERDLTTRMTTTIAAEYTALLARVAQTADVGVRSRVVAQLRREYRAVTARDYFPPPEREQVRRAIEDLVAMQTVMS